MMGEVPMFSSKAHVFVIDPVTKKSWIPSSKSAAQVNFFFDSARKSYRIISIELSKAIINSTVTAEMNFMKTSAKFGQWADVHAGVVYGLGFASEATLNEFSEQFHAIRDRTKGINQLADEITNLSSTDESVKKFTSNQTEVRLIDSLLTSDADQSSVGALKKLTLQNERLKQVLQQYSANIDKCEAKIADLKNSNKQLTSALEKAASQADAFKNVKSFSEQTVLDLKHRIELLEKEHSEKVQECSILQQRVGLLSIVEQRHKECEAQIKMSSDEKKQLQVRIDQLEREIDSSTHRYHDHVHEYCVEVAGHMTAITTAMQRLQSVMRDRPDEE